MKKFIQNMKIIESKKTIKRNNKRKIIQSHKVITMRTIMKMKMNFLEAHFQEVRFDPSVLCSFKKHVAATI